jgi:hypothetical protein
MSKVVLACASVTLKIGGYSMVLGASMACGPSNVGMVSLKLNQDHPLYALQLTNSQPDGRSGVDHPQGKFCISEWRNPELCIKFEMSHFHLNKLFPDFTNVLKFLSLGHVNIRC